VFGEALDFEVYGRSLLVICKVEITDWFQGTVFAESGPLARTPEWRAAEDAGNSGQQEVQLSQRPAQVEQAPTESWLGQKIGKIIGQGHFGLTGNPKQ